MLNLSTHTLKRPGLMKFLCQCEELFGRDNICIFTTVNEARFRNIASRLVSDGYAPEWFAKIRYIDWAGEHKDLRFVDENIDNVIMVDDYPPYIKQTQKHRLIEVNQYIGPYNPAMPDMNDKEFESLIVRIKDSISASN